MATQVREDGTVRTSGVPKGVRAKVLKRDALATGGLVTCANCKATPAEVPGMEVHVDHIDPWALGGSDARCNLVTMCGKCNRMFGGKRKAPAVRRRLLQLAQRREARWGAVVDAPRRRARKARAAA